MEEHSSRISQIPTSHNALGDLELFNMRYGNAIHSYFRKRLQGNQDAIDDCVLQLYQKVSNGTFKQQYDSKLGRFRYFLKRTLKNIATDWQRKHAKRTSWGNVEELPEVIDEQEFVQADRDYFIRRAYEQLKENSRNDLRLELLDLLADEETQAVGAKELAGQMAKNGQTVDANRIYVEKSRLRDEFARVLYVLISEDIGTQDKNMIIQELCELGLWAFVRDRIQTPSE